MSYPDLYLLIDGERLGAAGRRTIPVVNPATGKTLAQFTKFDISQDPKLLVSGEGRPARGGPANSLEGSWLSLL